MGVGGDTRLPGNLPWGNPGGIGIERCLLSGVPAHQATTLQWLWPESIPIPRSGVPRRPSGLMPDARVGRAVPPGRVPAPGGGGGWINIEGGGQQGMAIRGADVRVVSTCTWGCDWEPLSEPPENRWPCTLGSHSTPASPVFLPSQGSLCKRRHCFSHAPPPPRTWGQVSWPSSPTPSSLGVWEQ